MTGAADNRPLLQEISDGWREFQQEAVTPPPEPGPEPYVLTGINPSSGPAGTGIPGVVLTGTGFPNGGSVAVKGTSGAGPQVAISTGVTDTEVTVNLNAMWLFAGSGTYDIVAAPNPDPGGVDSNPVQFTVT